MPTAARICSNPAASSIPTRSFWPSSRTAPILEEGRETTSLHAVRTLYLDDLCVDESVRGRHIGRMLYERVLLAARELGCSRVTLHAWNFNESAFGFYEKLGMTPLYTTMEQKL